MQCLRLVFVFLLLAGSVFGQNLASTLQPKLENKMLELRSPRPGPHLSVGPKGDAKGEAQNGLRSLDAYLLVKKIDMHGSTLVIETARHAVVWNGKLRRAEFADLNMPATVSFELPAGVATSESQFVPVFYKVFFTPTETAKRACTPAETQQFADIAAKVSVQQDRKSDIRFGLPWMDPNPVICFPGGDRVREVGRTMQPPREKHTVDPSYSEHARLAGTTGTVIFMVAMDDAGVPTDAVLVRSLDAGLNFNALDALRGWRFEPARLDGKPTACAVNIRVNFKLR